MEVVRVGYTLRLPLALQNETFWVNYLRTRYKLVINRYLESRVGDHWREPLALVRRIVDHGPFPLSTTGSGLALWIFDERGFPVPVHVLVPVVGGEPPPSLPPRKPLKTIEK